MTIEYWEQQGFKIFQEVDEEDLSIIHVFEYVNDDYEFLGAYKGIEEFEKDLKKMMK